MVNKAEEYRKGILAGEENILIKLRLFLDRENKKIIKSRKIFDD